MAKLTEGVANFPATANDIYGLIETLIIQNIRSVKSANRLEDAYTLYDRTEDTGMVVEEAVIEKAKSYVFDKNAFDKTPKDPTLHVKYFKDYEAKQYGVTVRRNDIRKVLSSKSMDDVEGIASKIIDTLTQGEGADEFKEMRNGLYKAAFKDYSTVVLGGNVPLNLKGVIYAAREMYNHLIGDNSDMTGTEFESSTAPENVRIAISEKLLDLIDVKELADTFNLSKEEMFGKIVKVTTTDLTENDNDYVIYVYDKNALIELTRLREYSQDISGKGLFTNHYLTVERMYAHCDLFKGCKLDCSKAANAALTELIGAK